MRVIVSGAREWTDEEYVFETLDRALGSISDVIVVEGCANGVDRIVETWCKDREIEIEHHPAHWRHVKDCPIDCKKMIGKPAGAIRNQEMLNSGADFVICFHPDIDKAKGTKHMKTIAEKAGVPVYLFVGR